MLVNPFIFLAGKLELLLANFCSEKKSIENLVALLVAGKSWQAKVDCINNKASVFFMTHKYSLMQNRFFCVAAGIKYSFTNKQQHGMGLTFHIRKGGIVHLGK